MKVKDIIDQFIAGDWGEETCSNETPCAVTCVRGADIIPISEYNFSGHCPKFCVNGNRIQL